MSIGGRIKAARKAAGLSQEELARRADLSLNGFADIEREVIKDPHYSSLRKIADALGVPIGELLEAEPVPFDAASEVEAEAPKAPAPSPEILEGGEWERRRPRIVGLTLEATALRKRWAKELQEGGLAEHRAMEISFAIKGVLEYAESQTLLGGLENTDKANAKQVKRLREELERLVGLLELSVEQVTTGLHFKSIIDGVVFEQGRATPVETGKKNHA